jgi:aryl-alcohol dehydrogenase-like predicted oxidoreductase
MEKRGTRDQMVIATKYGSGYRAYNRENEPLQSNFTGPLAKRMHISVRDSLRKLRTDYIDILCQPGTSVHMVHCELHLT